MEYEEIRRLVIRRLKSQSDGQVNLAGDNFIRKYAEQNQLPYNRETGARILDVFHDLYREGIIASGTDHELRWPFYRVTEFGQRVLNLDEVSPHDPTGYVRSILQNIEDIDPVIIQYLDEGLGCYLAQRFLAAAVMTGCAAEKAMLLLVDSFGSALADPKEKERFQSAIGKQRMINRKYDELWKRLEPKQDKLPRELSDDLHIILDRVFDLLRSTRNNAGHPTGKIIDRDTVHANFILFRTYCIRMYKLMDFLEKTPI